MDERRYASGCRHQLVQEFQPLCGQLIIEKVDARRVAARPSEAGNKAESDRVFGGEKDDRDRRGCRLGRQRTTCKCGDHRDLTANQVGRQLRQPIYLILGEAVDDRHVIALDIAGVFETLAEYAQTVRARVSSCGVEPPDHRHRRLLRARRKRPRCHCAAEQRDELAAFHSITSSAMESSEGGTMRPSIRAVWALMTSSNLIDCTTGRSAGLAPLRIRPT